MRHTRRTDLSDIIEPKHILAEVSKLCRLVASLDRGVRQLSGRIEPFEGEVEPAYRPWIKCRIDSSGPTLKDILDVLRQADSHIEAIERDVAACQAKIDQISNDAWSRDDFKAYVDRERKKN